MSVTFGQVAVDCADAARQAAFWSGLTGRPVADGGNEQFALIPAEAGFPALMFLQVPEPRVGKNRLHLDLVATDRASTIERAVALGAGVVAEFAEYGVRWTTLTDPEGNVFDVADPEQ